METSPISFRTFNRSHESTPVNNPLNPCMMWLESIRGLFTGAIEDTTQLRRLALNTPDTSVCPRDVADKIRNLSTAISRNPQDTTLEARVANLISDLNPESIILPGRSPSYSNHRSSVFSPSTTPINYSKSPNQRVYSDFTPIETPNSPRNRADSCTSSQIPPEDGKESPSNSNK